MPCKISPVLKSAGRRGVYPPAQAVGATWYKVVWLVFGIAKAVEEGSSQGLGQRASESLMPLKPEISLVSLSSAKPFCPTSHS